MNDDSIIFNNLKKIYLNKIILLNKKKQLNILD